MQRPVADFRNGIADARCAVSRGTAIRACRARTQASLAVSADGERWTLLNASPDLRAQLAATPALHPRGALRGSPIEAVVLTGAEIDQTAGLLNLRERQPFTLLGTAETLAALGAQSDVRRARARCRDAARGRARHAIRAAGRPDGGAVHRARQGAALSRDAARRRPAVESGANVGVEITADGDDG